jgi:hypothetical protein
MSDVREFKVTAESMRRVGGRRMTRKQAGGSAPVDTIGVVADSMKDAASHAAGAYGQTAQGVTPMSSSGTLTSQIIPPVAMSMDPVGSKGAVALAQTEMAGGSVQRVELKKPVHKTRVALRAPRKLRALGQALGGAGAGAKTHKVRKIGLSLKKISKKLRKAHKTAKKAAVMSIDTIKDTLVKAGLLKGGSKAPEPLLRKMYADYKTTKQGL